MSQTLFETKNFSAIEAALTSQLIRIFGRITLVLLIVSLVALVFVPWQQTARGTGSVVALDPQERPQAVLSPAKGIVSYVRPDLREGSKVQQGELLLRLTPFAEGAISQFDAQIMALEAKRSAAESSRSVVEQNADLQKSSGERLTESLRQDYNAAREKWEQSKNKVEALRAELADKLNQLRIAELATEKGLESREQLFSKRQAAESQRAKVDEAENGVDEAYASLVSKEEEIEAKLQEIDIKNRQANQKILEEMQKINTIEKEILDVQNKRAELDRNEIRAPRSGYIQQWFGIEGSDTIKEGDQLFVVVPDTTELAVELRVSGNDMPLIREGDLVRLQFEGWPAVQFVGWPSVAIGTFGGKVNRVYPTDDGNGNFRIIVTEFKHFDGEADWPDSRYLRQGVRANGWVLLQKVTLGYEIWRSFNGFPPARSYEKSDDSSKPVKIKAPKL
jgi:multidrug resistance efflux pump